MDAKNVSDPYSPLTETRSLFNNPKWSDVRFIVDGQTVYGHKYVLRMGSPVFESMFFGELQENQDEIEIRDLSLVGFKNALRYIYGFEIDYELFDLYESFMAADKYLLHHFSKAFFAYIKGRLDAKSSCLIYDQLIKIGEREEISLAYVRKVIIESGKETFSSDHFTQIDQETLISLLSLEELRIAEADLLEAVSKWVNHEVQRQDLPVNGENRRLVFEPIKGYILFTALTYEKVSSCSIIAELLTPEERGLLVLHLLDKKNPLTIELKTARRASSHSATCSVFVSVQSIYFSSVPQLYPAVMSLRVNRKVAIQAIHLIHSVLVPIEFLCIIEALGKKDERKEIAKKSVKDGKWSFSFDPPFTVQPGSEYFLVNCAIQSPPISDFNLNRQLELNYKGSVMFYLQDSYRKSIYSFVRGIDFALLD